jgi:hypothetical protein
VSLCHAFGVRKGMVDHNEGVHIVPRGPRFALKVPYERNCRYPRRRQGQLWMGFGANADAVMKRIDPRTRKDGGR